MLLIEMVCSFLHDVNYEQVSETLQNKQKNIAGKIFFISRFKRQRQTIWKNDILAVIR